MVGVKVIGSDPDFQPELAAAGSRLAVVKFTMAGCRPCIRIAPAFNMFSNKYPHVVFLEVDVHVCQGTAGANNISATPTFLFFRNRVRVDQYQGADAAGLEEKINCRLDTRMLSLMHFLFSFCSCLSSQTRETRKRRRSTT
uniref:Thioredoxin like 1 n=1 Tax=Xiphophorus couchianus TaxID=32473 RepID=A0A3B5LMY9_9TELE